MWHRCMWYQAKPGDVRHSARRLRFGVQLNELLCDLEHTTSPEGQSPRLYKMARIAISEEEMISKLLLAISLLDSN